MVKTPKRKIPKAPIKRLLKDSGARQVSDKAVDEFINMMEDQATKAVVLAKHAKRTRVLPSDIPTAGSPTAQKVKPPKPRRKPTKPKKK